MVFGYVYAQNSGYKPCGFHTSLIPVDYSHNKDFVNYVKHYSLKDISATPDTIPVKLHLIRNNDGSGQDATLVELNNELAVLNSYFINANLVFKYCPEVEYIDDSTYYNYEYETENDALFGTHNEPHAINVYFAGNVSFQGGSVGGLGSGIGYIYEGIIMDYDAVGSGITYTHEMGHVFHLRHTHGKYNWNLTDCNGDSWDDLVIPDEVWCMGAYRFDNNMGMDTNSDGIPDCLQVGDDICDTPSEPNLSVDSLTSGCTYVGYQRDYYGDLFQPLIGNIMSYGPCKDHFSAGQFAKIRYAFETYGLHLQCGCEGFTEKTVTNNDDTGVGSFRWALECANWHKTPVTVEFDIPTKSSVITLGSRLPFVQKNVTIDGTSQTSGGVIIDGSLLTEDGDYGFYIYGDTVEINGVTIRSFPTYGLMNYDGYDHFVLKNCTIDSNKYYGLYLRRSANSTLHGNTIVNNEMGGMYLRENSTIEITGNTISNNQYSGINLSNDNYDITIGGSGTNNANIITGNNYYGIHIQDSSNNINIYNNFIGTDMSSSPDTGNGYYGVSLSNCYDINIGDANKGNVLCSNGYFGIGIYNMSHRIKIEGNSIGTDKTGTISIPNVWDGIRIDSSYDISIGSTSSGDKNMIANNYRGIQIIDNSYNCFIQQNSLFCNTYDMRIEEGSNNDVEAPVITAIPSNYTVQGTGIPNSTINVYRSNTSCSVCEGEIYIGMGPGGPTWEVTTTLPINNNDQVTAMASVDENSSVFSTCFTASGLPFVNANVNTFEPFKIYPNPVKTGKALILESKSGENIRNVKIRNVLGQEILSKNINSTKGIIELNGLLPGIYLISINGTSYEWDNTIIIQP